MGPGNRAIITVIVAIFVIVACAIFTGPLARAQSPGFTAVGTSALPVKQITCDCSSAVDSNNIIHDGLYKSASAVPVLHKTQAATKPLPDNDPDISYTVIKDRLNTLGEHPVLTENQNAHDPSYQELMSFLKKDDTVRNKYDYPNFTCADFATELQNHAATQGIRCGYAGIKFLEKETGHAINVFNTVDQGPVYVDVTGGKTILSKNLREGMPYFKMGTISSLIQYW